MMQEVYLSLGGNIGDTESILRAVIDDICLLPKIKDVQVSAFYKTPPFEAIPQRDYLNAACRFHTSYSPGALLQALVAIEIKHGKEPKPKTFPRKIDIDILFFGEASIKTQDLTVPHPRWKERLFVLIPLLDLMKKTPTKGPKGLSCEVLENLIERFPKIEREKITEFDILTPKRVT